MRMMNRSYQRGITLTGLILAGIVVVVVAIIGMRVVPEVIEFWKIQTNIKAVAADPKLRQASFSEIREAYSRRAIVEHTSAITPQDLEISREGNRLAISFAYNRQITLFGPVSLLIEFEGSSD